MYTRTPHLATCVPASTPRDLAFLEAATHSSTIVSQFFLAFIPSPGPGVPPDERCIANVDLSPAPREPINEAPCLVVGACSYALNTSQPYIFESRDGIRRIEARSPPAVK
ncbi:hypothetical protein VDGL01_01885 [Verticillium dahliae]